MSALRVDSARPVNNPTELASNMSSNEQVMKLCSNTFTITSQEDAPWITSRLFYPEFEQDRLTTHDFP